MSRATSPSQIPATHLLAIVDRAVRNGTHSMQWPGIVCAGCGEWCQPWWANEQRKSFCKACSPKDRRELAQEAAVKAKSQPAEPANTEKESRE